MQGPPLWVRAGPRSRPKFLAWDVTAPDDSVDFAKRMRRLRWRNLLDAAPTMLRFIERPSRISLFMPCGPNGTNNSSELFSRIARNIQREFFDPRHGTGGHPGIFYISAHGIPGFLFSEHHYGVLIANSTIIDKPGDPGGRRYHTVPPARFQWNSPDLKYIIFAACRQLAGKPQQALWARAMRGANPLHGILGYRETSPGPRACIRINRRFINALRNRSTILRAWRNAHRGGLADRWAALIHEGALNDTVTQWSRDGRLRSSPSPSGRILYFDSQTWPGGRRVRDPWRYIDMSLQASVVFGVGPELPHWTLARPGQVGILNFKLTIASGTNFEPGDRIWIAAAQVRPDYFPPFDIRQLFSFILPTSETLAQHGISVLAKIHDRRIFSNTHVDTYEFRIPTPGTPQARRMSRWFSMLNPRHIQLKIRLGNFWNDHLPLFYLMGRVKKAGRGGRTFGIPTRGRREIVDQSELVDDFQFAVFLLRRSP